MKVIYIMGAGHIGSTVLDLTISSHPRVESLGEIAKFHRYGWAQDEDRLCACGATVYDCEFWTRVRQRWTDIMGTDDADRYMFLQPRFERTRSAWARLLRNRFRRTPEFTEYLKGTEALYRAVLGAGGREYVVDSSLTPKRAYAQSLNPTIDLYLIHLVRDGRAVMWSLMKPKERRPAYVPAPPERTTKYWVSANLQSAWAFRRVPRSRRLRIRYEDFVLNPNIVLERVGALVSEDMKGLMKDDMLAQAGRGRHTVAGNRVRFTRDEDLRVRGDFAWLENLAEEDRRLFWRRAGWLARRLGYVKDQVDYEPPPA